MVPARFVRRCGHIKKREQPAFLQVTHARVFRRNAYRREDVYLISFRCTCITFTPSLTGISSTRYPLERINSMAFMVCSVIQHLYLSMLRKFLAPEMQSSQSFLRFSPILFQTTIRMHRTTDTFTCRYFPSNVAPSKYSGRACSSDFLEYSAHERDLLHRVSLISIPCYLPLPFMLRVRSNLTVSPACSLNRLYSAVNAADFFLACVAPSLSPAATQASRSSFAYRIAVSSLLCRWDASYRLMVLVTVFPLRSVVWYVIFWFDLRLISASSDRL